MTSQTRQTMEKAAYAAVGAPVAAVKALSARVTDLRDSVAEARRDVGEELEAEMTEWIAEGERIVDRSFRRVRSSLDEVESKAISVDVPSVDLTTINGIGPNYAEQLADAGVSGVAGFLSATGTPEDIANLAEHTGFSAGTIESWRDQVDLSRVNGVGGAYAQLLHHADVWTLRQLSKCDPADLADTLNTVDMRGTLDQMPSIYATKKWIDEAAGLISSN